MTIGMFVLSFMIPKICSVEMYVTLTLTFSTRQGMAIECIVAMYYSQGMAIKCIVLIENHI